PIARCSSITTRCTPTSSSTRSARKQAAAGGSSAASRAQSASRSSAASTSRGRERPRLQAEAQNEGRLAAPATLRKGMTSTPRVEAAVQRSDLVKQALETATGAHAGQLRHGSDGLPYIDHPVAVAEILASIDYDDEVLAA